MYFIFTICKVTNNDFRFKKFNLIRKQFKILSLKSFSKVQNYATWLFFIKLKELCFFSSSNFLLVLSINVLYRTLNVIQVVCDSITKFFFVHIISYRSLDQIFLSVLCRSRCTNFFYIFRLNH